MGVQKESLYRGSDVRCEDEDECGVEKQFWDDCHLRLAFRRHVDVQILGLTEDGNALLNSITTTNKCRVGLNFHFVAS